MSAPYHILIVEDDPATRLTLASYFEATGFRVTEAAEGAGLRAALARGPVDLVLLDINLPGEDGFSLLREIRRTSDLAVIMVTNKTDAVDRILGLELGAHDYVTKPVNLRELLARAKNLIRLMRMMPDTAGRDDPIAFDGWTVDRVARRLSDPAGQDVALTRAEFDLLVALASHPGRAMTRDTLLDHVSRRDSDPFDRTIDVLVGRLRRKIEPDPRQPRRLITVHGIGYLFVQSVAPGGRAPA
jgi:two-component system torCAD operon response regulator TorR